MRVRGGGEDNSPKKGWDKANIGGPWVEGRKEGGITVDRTFQKVLTKARCKTKKKSGGAFNKRPVLGTIVV